MKKLLSVFIITAFAFTISTSFARAEEGSTDRDDRVSEARAKVEARKAEAEAKRAEFEQRVSQKKEEAKTRKAEKDSKVVARKQEIAQKEAAKVVKKLEEFVRKLNHRYTKVSEKIAKLSAEGKNTDALEALLGTAKAKIDAAGVKVGEVKTALDQLTVTDQASFKAAVQSIRDGVKAAKDTLKEAQEAVVAVVKAVKPGELKPKPDVDSSNTSGATTETPTAQ